MKNIINIKNLQTDVSHKDPMIKAAMKKHQLIIFDPQDERIDPELITTLRIALTKIHGRI